jgi:hypothetical protein
VPRCGALSLLQKPLQYRGDSAKIAPTLKIKTALLACVVVVVVVVVPASPRGFSPDREAAAKTSAAAVVAVQRRGPIPKPDKAKGKKRAPGAPAGSRRTCPWTSWAPRT